MSEFTKKTTQNGQVQYRKDGNLVAKADIPEDVIAKLKIVAEGTTVPESAEVTATPENTATPPVDSTEPDSGTDPESTPNPEGGKPATAPKGQKLVKIHLERNHMVNGKVYLGGYETEVDDETGEVLSETPVEIEVTKEMAEELLRNDRNHTTYEKNLLRGQNKSRVAPQVKDVKA